MTFVTINYCSRYVLIACSFFFRFYPPIQRAVCIISTHIHDITFPDDSLSTNNRRWNCWFIITNTKLRGQETWIYISSFRIFPMEDEFSWIFHHNLFFFANLLFYFLITLSSSFQLNPIDILFILERVKILSYLHVYLIHNNLISNLNLGL